MAQKKQGKGHALDKNKEGVDKKGMLREKRKEDPPIIHENKSYLLERSSMG